MLEISTWKILKCFMSLFFKIYLKYAESEEARYIMGVLI